MLSLELLNTSIVVLASDHNPTVLNPDFLSNTEIILNDWGWGLAESPITTPPFASVKYDSGVSLTVEPSKLQIIHEGDADPVDSKISDIAKKYMSVLQHVQYKAIGVNFVGVVSIDDAKAFMKQHFLNEKIMNDDGLDSIGIKLLYSTSTAGDQFTLELDPAIKVGESDDQHQTAIISKGNFNRSYSTKASIEEKIQEFPVVSDCWKQYMDTLNRVLS